MNRFVLSFVAVLSMSALATQAQAGGVSIGFSVPFFSFGIGLGVGPSYTWPACGYGYAPPAYVCNHPANYPANYPANDPPPVAAAPSAPAVADAPPWVPATPGPGHWVPDPQPYIPPPATVAKSAPASAPGQTREIVTVIRSGTVPVYVVTHRTPEGVALER